MKVDTEISIQASPERIWNILTAFDAYPEWNPYIQAVRGEVAHDAKVEMDIRYLQGMDKGLDAIESALITALAPPKYLSWVWNHPFGNWWLSAERVFRIKQRDDGKVFFFHEIYFTGFSTVKVLGFLDFRRDALEQKVKLSMIRMNEALKARAEHAPPPP
ncbi:MAG TPA: SRPBCC domain-containing protein [Fibrobacteria bacterium]|nr:SRPBCC domain-containing protein [Fibrobacteria bacterium]